jgi:hypothetical protein
MRLTIPKFLRRVETRRVKVMRMVRRRTPYAHDDVPFITLWSQKSGCTSVLKWHLYHAGLLDEALAFRSGKTSLNIHVFQNDWVKSQAGHRRQILRQIREQQKPVINFVRDPWARAYSCYLHSYSPALARLQNRGVENNAMRLRQQVLRDIYGEDRPLDTPYSFLQYLQWLQAQALDGLNPHHSPQYSALYDVAPVRHYRLEDFKPVINTLEQEFGLRDSSQSSELFTSAHHKPKAPLPRDEALASLLGGLPLARDKDYQLPTVTGELLKGTEMGDIIHSVLAKDLAIYDGIQPLPCKG